MKIAVSSDMYSPLLDVLFKELKERGHSYVYYGPKKDEPSVDWPEVTLKAIQEVQAKRAEEAIVLCWTGTGCSIVANKVPNIRAALCHDAETARGARIWNHANVLALSIRLTSDAMLQEILKNWFETPFSTDEWNLRQIEQVRKAETSSFTL